ncbi:hypothetical protein Tco_0934558 [Tanacetum coccineum]
MVLSLLSQMPPTSTPPTIEESLAKLANNIDKLELVVKRLAASTANLVSITSQTTFTKNESNDHTSNNKTDILETKTDVITDTTSLITSKPDQTVTPFFIASSAKSENIVASQSPTVSLSVLSAPLTDLIHESSKVQQEIVIFRSTKLHQTSALVILIESMSSTSPCLETFPPRHRCGPPKIVLLQNEPEPPWKPHDTRYTAMSLEDKTRFKGRSIDMCKKTTWASRTCEPYDMNGLNNNLMASLARSKGLILPLRSWEIYHLESTPGFDAEQHYFSSANDCNVMTMAEQKNRLDNGYRYTLYSSKSPTIMGKKSRDSDGDVAAQVHELELVWKDDPLFSDDSIDESSNILKPQTTINNQSAFVLEDLKTEVDEMIKLKVNLEVQYIAISSQHMETMNRLEIAERKAIELRKQYDKLKMTCDKILDSEDGCNVRNSLCKSTSMFGIQLILLGLVLYLVVQKIFSHGGMEDELATT